MSTQYICTLFKNHLHDFVLIKIKFRKKCAHINFGQGLKSEHTLVCIVIDDRNVSLRMRCNVSPVLTMRSSCGRDIVAPIKSWSHKVTMDLRPKTFSNSARLRRVKCRQTVKYY